MGRYFIHLAYNGACYNGWQTQPELPTVQLTLEKALSTLLRTPIAVVGCGRTDTGVHASDFYAHFDVGENLGVEESECLRVEESKSRKVWESKGLRIEESKSLKVEESEGRKDEEEVVGEGAWAGISLDSLIFKLNNMLPPDIAVYDIFRVADNAHARFDATARTYQYHVSDRRLPFRQGQYCRIWYRPDLELMNRAAQVLMEYEDFTSFAKLHTQVKTNICHLSEARWDFVPVKSYESGVKGDADAGESPGTHTPEHTTDYEWVFTIRSNRFLRNMVRSVTGTLLDVGRGKLSIDGLRAIVEKKDRCAAGVSMPACGLFLTKVEYPWQGELRVKS